MRLLRETLEARWRPPVMGARASARDGCASSRLARRDPPVRPLRDGNSRLRPTGPRSGWEGGGQVRALAACPRTHTFTSGSPEPAAPKPSGAPHARLPRAQPATPGSLVAPNLGGTRVRVSRCPRDGRGPGPRVAEPAVSWRPSRQEPSRPWVSLRPGRGRLV